MRVLIADDSVLVRTAVAAMLARDGHEVVHAEDGVTAIQRFYEYPTDLVLLDISMPKVSGYLVCRLIKEDPAVASVPVLILTSRDTAEDRYWAEKSGADGYITKENLGEPLLAAVRSAGASRELSELSGQDRLGRSLDQVDVLTRVTAMLDRNLFETTVVNDLVTIASNAGDLRSTIRQTLIALRRFVEYELAGVAIPSDRLAVVRADRPVSSGEIEGFRNAVCAQLLLHGPVVLASDEFTIEVTEEDLVFDDGGRPTEWPSTFGVALRSRGAFMGVLVLVRREPGAFTAQVARTLRLVEYPLANSLEAARNYQKAMADEARLSLSALSEKLR